MVSPCHPPTGRTCRAAPSSQGLPPCLLWSGRGLAGGARSARVLSPASQWRSLLSAGLHLPPPPTRTAVGRLLGERDKVSLMALPARGTCLVCDLVPAYQGLSLYLREAPTFSSHFQVFLPSWRQVPAEHWGASWWVQGNPHSSPATVAEGRRSSSPSARLGGACGQVRATPGCPEK